MYIDETKRRLETRLKEHKDACTKCLTSQPRLDKRPPNLLEQNAREQDHAAKEALSIHATPEDARFNRDSGYELPDCWIAMYKKLRGGASFSSARRPMRGAHNRACTN